MKHALSKVDESALTATQIAKSTDLLTADTIINYFKHCGVQPRTDEVTDPFADLEESEDEQEEDRGSQDELQELVQQFEPELNARDYINVDEDLPTCDTYDNNENWRNELRDEVLSGSHAKKKTQAVSENDSEEKDESDEESPSTVTTFREAVDSVKL